MTSLEIKLSQPKNILALFISSEWVITAAHCLEIVDTGHLLRVSLGSYDRQKYFNDELF